MAVGHEIRLSWINDQADMTNGASPSASSQAPLSKAFNEIRGDPARWDMSAASSITITGENSVDEDLTASLFMIKGHNGRSDTTIRLRLYSALAQSGTEVYDSTVSSIGNSVPWESSIPGIPDTANTQERKTNLDSVFSVAFESVQYRSYQIDIEVPSPVNDIFEIDKMWIGFGWAPGKNFSTGTRVLKDNEASEIRDTLAGGQRNVDFPARRALELQFQHTNDDRDIMAFILDQAGNSRDMAVVTNPLETGFSKYLRDSIYRLNGEVSYTIEGTDTSSQSVFLREN